MFHKICSQKHGPHFPVKLAASLQDTLECAIPLIRMASIKNFVVGIDTSLWNMPVPIMKKFIDYIQTYILTHTT